MTGSAGFVAPYVAARLEATFPGRALVKLVRLAPVPEGGYAVELTNPSATDDLIRTVKPGIVVHLAAHSSVAKANRSPSSVWRDNRDGSYWLAKSIARHAPEATVFLASTAEVYGSNLKHGPADETTPPMPHGPYANSKLASEFVFEEILTDTNQLLIARPFNHTGPGQMETFVVASFAAQLARIEAGLVPPTISVGNLDAKRDFLDVRDVANAYIGILKAADRLPKRAIVNVARGEAMSIREILDLLCSLAKVEVSVEIDPSRLRPNEIPVATASTAFLSTLMDWPPHRPIIETLKEVLDDQRKRLKVVVPG
ncbi:GDP-mannose 4,6-dehydratase [Acuticoccus sp. M5D2P5]|uniref:GDP-mannose 4,6-dehydratase n=1 Tax=Acuticoccus kalidii TaxID=2910977 RepID=UPI001F3D06C1|nr:GDP-mannose 4,6-dehydratase [Acuticoccus kalidii]MCF3932602.1 GDP-mannose 4,6-dehydratase [Acuticoccus kalidii]